MPAMLFPQSPLPVHRRNWLLAAACAAAGGLARPLCAAEAFEWRPWPAGKRVPALNLPLADGTPWRLAAQSGHVVLANFWASWCAPCLQEMPELEAFSAQQGANGTQVVGIALDDPGPTQAMLERLGVTYPNLIDAPGPADAGVRLGNPAGVLPYSVLVSAEGRVLKTKIGPFEHRQDIAAWARP